MKILLTGATGFVGRNLLARLPYTCEVTCLVRPGHEAALPASVRLRAVPCDLSGGLDVAALPPSVDVIIHLAQGAGRFPMGAAELFHVNLAATQSLADHAIRAGAKRFIFASSGNVYGLSEKPLAEESPVVPGDYYAWLKVAAEQLLGHYTGHFDVLILRLFAPYGPGQTGRMIPRLLEMVRTGQPVVLRNGGQPFLNPIYIDDLVDVLVSSLELAGSHTVNVAGPVTCSVADIATWAAENLGLKPVFRHDQAGPGGNLVADTAKMIALFGKWNLLATAEGIRRMIHLERKHV